MSHSQREEAVGEFTIFDFCLTEDLVFERQVKLFTMALKGWLSCELFQRRSGDIWR